MMGGQNDESGTPMMRGGSGSGAGANMVKTQAQTPVFLITIEDRETCKLHRKYNEWLTKYEEEQKELEKKRLEEQDLKQQQ